MKKKNNNENGWASDLKDRRIQINDITYQEIFDVMIQNAPVSMYVLKDWSYSYVNQHCCDLFGYSEAEMLSGEITVDKLIHPDDFNIVKERIQYKDESQEDYARYRLKMYKKDGNLIHVEVHSKKRIENGETIIYGTVFNVTEEVTANLKLQENKERFKSLFDHNPDAIFTFDMEGNFKAANSACESLTGYSTDELLDISFIPLIAAEDLAITLENFENATRGNVTTYEIILTRRDGKRRNIEVTNFPMKSAGNIIGAYGIAKDITEKVEHKKLMEELAFFDSLTKLPNRKLFEDRLSQVLKISEEIDSQSAVLFLDLDRFKLINDSLGHHLGDEFLKIVSQRLQATVRKTDTVGRFAGDEFAVLLPKTEKEESISLAERLNQALSEPFEIKGHSVTATVSIGIAFSSGKKESVDSLIKKADTAMYYTKKNGKNSYTVYSEEMDQKTIYKLAIEQNLKSAIANQELVLYYQPITNLETGEISAMEALIRWNHPVFGLVPPDHFIPISEESGQIVSIGKWVLQTACAQNKRWQEQGVPPFKVCVNVSTIQLQHPSFVQTVKDILQDTGLDSKWLELEVTESILMEETKTLKDSLLNLKALGISMSIDDFGTGYTSLSYLRQFSFDRIKIDRSFIADINKDLNGKAITSTIISLAHKLKMKVIAEGIEDETQLSFLKDENCNEGQGYYFSRPLPAELHEFSSTPKKYW